VKIGGATIPEGFRVWLLFIGGGLDSTHFPDPERFDIQRENADQHLAFGHGRHLCLGNRLTRLETRVALQILFERIPDIRIVPGQSLDYLPVLTVLTLKHLAAEWTVEGERRKS
jgi:cytochrome P450